MKTDRSYRRPNDWKTLIEEFDQSGTRVRDFCLKKKISTSGFYTWRQRLRLEQPSSHKFPQTPSPPFVPITLMPEFRSTPVPQGLVLTYPNGCQVCLYEAFDPSLLKKLSLVMGVAS